VANLTGGRVPEVSLRRLDVLADATWQFRDGAPVWHDPVTGYQLATFDPFPGYPHDQATARTAVAEVVRVWPPAWDITVYLADREDSSRVNGFSQLREPGRYVGDEWVTTAPAGTVVLSGKRIPPHPAMTRYLIAHEYGHHVEWMINQRAGARHLRSDDTARRYLTVRHLGDAALHHGDGGRWHSSVHEVLACDFRILVAGVETGFWPHPGIARPEEVPGLEAWWDEMQEAAHDLLSWTAQPAGV
jgi:hypothetical protein